MALLQSIATAPTYAMMGDLYAILADAEATGGAFTLIHAIVPPGGGPPPHRHARDDESFFVLEGVISFWIEGEQHDVGPGGFAHVRRGEVHRFTNESDATARMLIQTVPAGFCRMVREAGTAVPPGTSDPQPPRPGDLDKVIDACRRAGIELMFDGA